MLPLLTALPFHYSNVALPMECWRAFCFPSGRAGNQLTSRRNMPVSQGWRSWFPCNYLLCNCPRRIWKCQSVLPALYLFSLCKSFRHSCTVRRDFINATLLSCDLTAATEPLYHIIPKSWNFLNFGLHSWFVYIRHKAQKCSMIQVSLSMDYSNRMTGLYEIYSPAMQRNDFRREMKKFWP